MVEYINAIELVLLGLAFCLSRSKYTPGVLICFNLWVLFLDSQGDRRMEVLVKYYEMGSYGYQYLNDQVMILYLHTGVTYAVFAGVLLLMKSRLSFFAGLVVFVQSALQLIAGISVYFETYAEVDMTYLFDTHFIINNLFVILYVLIAWMCVYWSRKTDNYD
ncbi:TMhelix containing protein [Vibrio phage 1.275.O._10N.286.54.E11]|nr:TMhelix containing protein [Vibrio phage 1.275.O._10N.286.54.E11]